MMRSGIQQAVVNKVQKKDDDGALLTLEEINDNGVISTNLMAVLLFIIYLILGLAWYTFAEGNSPVVSIYFSITTLMTIGYGDVPVQNRLFGTFFVLIGAGIVGTIFGLVSFRIMEEQELLMNSRLTSFASKVGAIVEHHHKISKQAAKNKNMTKSESKRQLALDVSQKSDNDNETDFRENENNPYKYSRWRHLVVSSKETIRRIFRINPKKEPCQDLSELNVAIFEDEISDLKITLVTNIIMFFLVLIIGALCMSAIEGWDILDAVYWSSVTICTVGFGDLSPKTDGGRIFTMFFALIGCTLSVKGFSEIIRFPSVLKLKQNEIHVQTQFLRGLSEKTLKNIIDNDLFHRIPHLKSTESEIKKSEFVVMLLTMMGRLSERDIMLAASIFDKLDYNSDGVLNQDELAAEVRKARTRDRAHTMALMELESQRENREGGLKKAFAGAGEGILDFTDSMRTYGENVVHHLVSRPATRGDAYADETKGNDDQGRVHTQSHHSSILPRWFSSNRDDNDHSSNDVEVDTLHMTDNPILLSPDRLKGKHKIVRWGGGNDNNNNNNNNNNMNSNNKLNHLSSLHKIPTHDIENSSNSGSEVNSDYYYDSDDHDCYGGKSVYDVGSENSDQLNYSQNYGIASVKIANKKAHDEAKLRNATANAARNNNLSDVEDQKHNNNNNNNNNTNNNNYSNISHISSGVSTTISPSNVHQKKHNNEMFRSPERNNKNIEITPTQTELPKSMIFEMNKKMNNQMNFIRNNTVNQRIIINKNDGSNNTNNANNNNTNFTNNNAINSVNISGNNGNNSNNSSISSKSNEINTGNVIEIIPDNGVSLFHGDNKLTNNNNNNINNSNSNNITNMTLNIPTTRIMNSEQKLKLPNIQTSSQNFNDQNDPENAWLSVPLDDEKSPGK